MRMTLRNLLRYLDDATLKVADRTELQQMIQRSKRAQALIERVQQARIRSPDQFVYALPSTSVERVSAYLSLRMSEVQVEDFESEVLGADELFAEVVACSKLMSEAPPSVTGSIPLEARELVYAIGQAPITAEPGTEGAPRDLPFEDGPNDESAASLGTAPDKLPLKPSAAGRSRKSLVAFGGALILLLGTIGFAVWFGPWSGGDVALPSQQVDKVKLQPAIDVDEGGSISTDDDPEFDATQVGPQEPPDSGHDASADELPMRPNLAFAPQNRLAGGDPAEVIPDEPPPPIEIGHIAGAASVVAQRRQGGIWTRLEETVLENTHLVLLGRSPMHLTLGADHPELSVTGATPTSLFLGPHDDSGVFRLRLDVGRITVASQTTDVRCELTIGDHVVVVTFPEPDTRLLVERSRQLAIGADPRETGSESDSFVVVVQGRCFLESQGSRWVLPPTGTWMVASDAAPQVGMVDDQLSEPTVDPGSGLDRDPLIDRLESDAPLLDQLVTLMNDARSEVRRAAHEALIGVGDFQYVFDFLSDDRNKANWEGVIWATRRQIKDVPELASDLYEDLASLGSLQGTVYKLILGFSQQDLTAGADAELVEWLDHDELGLRVLALDNLKQITGGKTYMYRPDGDGVDRRRAIRRDWMRELERGEIRHPPMVPSPPTRLRPLVQPNDSDQVIDG